MFQPGNCGVERAETATLLGRRLDTVLLILET